MKNWGTPLLLTQGYSPRPVWGGGGGWAALHPPRHPQGSRKALGTQGGGGSTPQLPSAPHISLGTPKLPWRPPPVHPTFPQGPHNSPGEPQCTPHPPVTLRCTPNPPPGHPDSPEHKGDAGVPPKPPGDPPQNLLGDPVPFTALSKVPEGPRGLLGVLGGAPGVSGGCLGSQEFRRPPGVLGGVLGGFGGTPVPWWGRSRGSPRAGCHTPRFAPARVRART